MCIRDRVSTDPASNVGQVFGVTIGNQVVGIEAVAGLSALEIDPQAAAQAYRDRIVGPVRGVLPEAVSYTHLDVYKRQLLEATLNRYLYELTGA